MRRNVHSLFISTLIATAVIGSGQTVCAEPLVGIMNVSAHKIHAPWPVTRMQHPMSMVTLSPESGPAFLRAIETLRRVDAPTHMILTGHKAHLDLIEPLLPSQRKAIWKGRFAPDIKLVPTEDPTTATHLAAKVAIDRFGSNAPTVVINPGHHVTHIGKIAQLLEHALVDIEASRLFVRLVAPPRAKPTHAAMLVGRADCVADISKPRLRSHVGDHEIPGVILLEMPERVRVTPIDSLDAIHSIQNSTDPTVTVEDNAKSRVFTDVTHENLHGADALPVMVLQGVRDAFVQRSGFGLHVRGGRIDLDHTSAIDVHVVGSTGDSRNDVRIDKPAALMRVDLDDTKTLEIVETVSPSVGGSWRRITHIKPRGIDLVAPEARIDERFGGFDLR